jgi:limonene-1,2-epoxide hydrolase
MDAESTVTEFIRRVVAGDLVAAGELVTDDLEYDNVPIGKNHGREAMVKFLGSMSNGSKRSSSSSTARPRAATR